MCDYFNTRLSGDRIPVLADVCGYLNTCGGELHLCEQTCAYFNTSNDEGIPVCSDVCDYLNTFSGELYLCEQMCDYFNPFSDEGIPV